MILLLPLVLTIAFLTQPALGHTPPVILPTRLEFDASKAPKKCNDLQSFQSILEAWVATALLRPDASRRLIVRIRWSSTGGKQAEIVLVDEQGATLATRHTSYAATTECFAVLWAVARDAARILGAFDPPPPKAAVPPLVCPTCPECPPVAPSFPVRVVPTSPSPIRPPTTNTRSPILEHSFIISLGAILATGTNTKLDWGPIAMLGLLPSHRWSFLRVEFEAAWTWPAIESSRAQALTLVPSLCLLQGTVRFCGGLAATMYFTNVPSDHDDVRSIGANFRIGTELFRNGPLSLHADVFGRFPFAPASPLNSGTFFSSALAFE